MTSQAAISTPLKITPPSPDKFFTELTFDEVAQVISELGDRSNWRLDSVDVFLGTHPKYGRVHIVVPPAGKSLLFPLVVQDF